MHTVGHWLAADAARPAWLQDSVGGLGFGIGPRVGRAATATTVVLVADLDAAAAGAEQGRHAQGKDEAGETGGQAHGHLRMVRGLNAGSQALLTLLTSLYLRWL
jgi:hypothetical protein